MTFGIQVQPLRLTLSLQYRLGVAASVLAPAVGARCMCVLGGMPKRYCRWVWLGRHASVYLNATSWQPWVLLHALLMQSAWSCGTVAHDQQAVLGCRRTNSCTTT